MDKMIKTKLNNVLKAEAEYIMENEKDLHTKVDKMDTLFNLKKILDNYDELEPILEKYFTEKSKKQKFER